MPRPIVVKRVAFDAAPSMGTVLLIEGQRYEISALNPRRRRDGKPTTLITWRGHCSDCGQPFEQTSALIAKGLNRRCPQHCSPGRPVTTVGRRRKRRFLAGRPRASPRFA